MPHDRHTLEYLKRIARAESAWSRTPAPLETNALAARRTSARRRLRRMIGLDRIRRDLGPFKPTVELSPPAAAEGYRRYHGILHAEPDFDLPFWLLQPAGAGPFPIALLPHGHYAEHGLDYAAGIAASPEMREKIAREDRDVAIQAVRRGFVAIAPSTRGFLPACVPDITNRHAGSNCRSHALHCLLAGRTAMGERVSDLQRLLDWALSRPDADRRHTLVMGNSGGGVVAVYAAACDPRIATCVSSCAFCTLMGRNGAIHHCDCNAVPGILRFGEFHDIAALIAPRRLLVVHGRKDPLFPPEEIDRAVAHLRRRYAEAGAAEACHHVYGPEGHRFYADLMWPFILGKDPDDAATRGGV